MMEWTLFVFTRAQTARFEHTELIDRFRVRWNTADCPPGHALFGRLSRLGLELFASPGSLGPDDYIGAGMRPLPSAIPHDVDLVLLVGGREAWSLLGDMRPARHRARETVESSYPDPRRLRSPVHLSREIRTFCAQVAPAGIPYFIPVRASDAVPGGVPEEIVQARVHTEGGEEIRGWRIREWPSVLLQAETTSVWSTPAGILIDPCHPYVDGPRRLFVEDPEAPDECAFPRKIRIPLSQDPLVADFLTLCAAWDRRFTGPNDGQPSRRPLQPEETPLILGHLALIETMLTRGLTAYDACLCGSGRSYRECHQLRARDT